jgi:hypothetical protein
MIAQEMREMAAKKAEEWLIPDERLRLVSMANTSRLKAGIFQNTIVREIADAIRSLPLEAAK